MRNRSRLWSAGLTAAVMLAVTVSVASANRLSVSQTTFGMSSPRLTFTTSVTSTECEVTLSGSFHSSTARKVNGSLVGHVTAAAIGRCEGGTATALAGTLPWNILYSGFTGRLPVMTGVNLRLVGASFEVTASGVTCLARTDTTEPSGGTVTLDEIGQLTSIVADPSLEIDIDTGGFLCDIAGDVSLSGTGSGLTAPATLRLI